MSLQLSPHEQQRLDEMKRLRDGQSGIGTSKEVWDAVSTPGGMLRDFRRTPKEYRGALHEMKRKQAERQKRRPESEYERESRRSAALSRLKTEKWFAQKQRERLEREARHAAEDARRSAAGLPSRAEEQAQRSASIRAEEKRMQSPQRLREARAQVLAERKASKFANAPHADGYGAASKLGRRIARACYKLGLDYSIDVAGSGSTYLEIWQWSLDDAGELEAGVAQLASVRVSDHAHLGGGTGYAGGATDIEILTTQKIVQENPNVAGWRVSDAMKIIKKRLAKSEAN